MPARLIEQCSSLVEGKRIERGQQNKCTVPYKKSISNFASFFLIPSDPMRLGSGVIQWWHLYDPAMHFCLPVASSLETIAVSKKKKKLGTRNAQDGM
jgi:hypothetical protein